MHYIEHRKWRPIEGYFAEVREKIRPYRFWTDVVLLLALAILFVLLARSLPRVRVFFSVYVLLLVCNVIYLLMTRDKVDPANRKTRERPRTHAPWFWIYNNVAHSLLMVAVLLWASWKPVPIDRAILQEVLLFILCVTNSFIDFKTTREWYLPNLDERLDKELRAEKSPAPAVARPSPERGQKRKRRRGWLTFS